MFVSIHSSPLFFDLLLCSVCSSILYVVLRISRIASRRSHFIGIPGPLPKSYITGNLSQLFNAKGLPFHHNLTKLYGDVVKVYGFFGDEQLYISDPRALQSIIVKDQDSFEETTTFIETNKVIFGEGLVATVGDHHKRQRKIVNPAFSVPQLRKLVPKLYDVAHRLSDAVGKEIEGSLEVLDMAQWMSRVALESVGQAVLGYSFDPLDSPSNNPYTKAIRELIPALFRVSLIRQLAPFISRLGSPAFRRKLVEITPNATVQKIKMMSDVMYDTAKNILRIKKDTFYAHEQTHDPKDIISILLGQNKGSTAEEQLSDEELIGQMTVLIFGAQDTTSSALSRILFMLATHPIVQDNVRHEIQQARSRESNLRLNDDNIGYDQLLSLPLLDAVIKETLRL